MNRIVAVLTALALAVGIAVGSLGGGTTSADGDQIRFVGKRIYPVGTAAASTQCLGLAPGVYTLDFTNFLESYVDTVQLTVLVKNPLFNGWIAAWPSNVPEPNPTSSVVSWSANQGNTTHNFRIPVDPASDAIKYRVSTSNGSAQVVCFDLVTWGY